MPAAAMLIPLAIQAGGAIAGHFAGKKATKDASTLSPDEQVAQTGASGAAKGAGTAANTLTTQGMNTLAQPAGYYRKLLTGDRAAMGEATAAPRAALQEQVRGAQAGIARSGVRGAARDQITGNLARQQQGAVAGLTTGVQPMAASALTQIGGGMTQTGAGLYGTSGNIYSNLLGQGFKNRVYGREEGEKTSKGVMDLATRAAGTVSGAMGGNSGSSFGNFGKFGGTDTGDYSLPGNY